jgi:hypothetical protein
LDIDPDSDRAEHLATALRDVLNHIRPQGHPSWELNTCLVTNAQVTAWWATLNGAAQVDPEDSTSGRQPLNAQERTEWPIEPARKGGPSRDEPPASVALLLTAPHLPVAVAGTARE